jgi:hypothetical protein
MVLNQGDGWTYNFSNLPKMGSVSVFGTNPGGSLEFTVNSSTFQSGDMLQYEMFENSSLETPRCTRIMNSAPPFNPTCQRDFSWQDRQGAIRLTMLAGSVTVDSITVKAIVSGPSLSSYDVYSSTFTPVPEPAAVSLLGMVLLASVWGFRRTPEQRRRNAKGKGREAAKPRE